MFSGGGEKPPEAVEGEGEYDGDDAWGQDEGESTLPGLGGMPGLYDQGGAGNGGGGGGWGEQKNGGTARDSAMYDDTDVLPGFGPTDVVMDSGGGQGMGRDYGMSSYGAIPGGSMTRGPLPSASMLLSRPGEDLARKKSRWGP